MWRWERSCHRSLYFHRHLKNQPDASTLLSDIFYICLVFKSFLKANPKTIFCFQAIKIVTIILQFHNKNFLLRLPDFVNIMSLSTNDVTKIDIKVKKASRVGWKTVLFLAKSHPRREEEDEPKKRRNTVKLVTPQQKISITLKYRKPKLGIVKADKTSLTTLPFLFFF